MKKKLICFLLLTTSILSATLAYKIHKTSEYSSETYDQVYDEFYKLTNTNISETINKKNTYISKTATSSVDKTSAAITIPKINISYPVISDYSEGNLNIAPTKFVGPEPNTVGNFVIVGHNNWNKDFFSNLHKLEKNDIVELLDKTGNKTLYKVSDISEIEQSDFSCLNQDTNGKIELTLITCIKYKKNKRLVVKCNAI